MRYVIINSDNKVVNVVVSSISFIAPRNHTVIVSDTAKIGYIYNTETEEFSAPE